MTELYHHNNGGKCYNWSALAALWTTTNRCGTRDADNAADEQQNTLRQEPWGQQMNRLHSIRHAHNPPHLAISHVIFIFCTTKITWGNCLLCLKNQVLERVRGGLTTVRGSRQRPRRSRGRCLVRGLLSDRLAHVRGLDSCSDMVFNLYCNYILP